MSARDEALHAINRALGLIPKDGAMTPLDTGLVRAAMQHAGECVGRIEELKKKRKAPKAKEPAA